MYRIEYDIETGLVHNLAIVEDENYPETLVDGVAYYDGGIPEDVEGYEKVLYYKIVNTQKNPEGISTFTVWEGNLYAEYKPIEGWMELADAKDVADLFIQSQKPKGLMFKEGDNSVFAKTMNGLVLGTYDFTVCVIARTKGSNLVSEKPVTGFTATGESRIRIGSYDFGTANGIHQVMFASPSSNSITFNKVDTTTNLHHIVITRSGTLVKCIINGRLIKSATQDRVLDFSNFIYDVANTSYFYGGSVYNYAMTEAEALALWNGGRYDEVRLPYGLFNGLPSNKTSFITDNWSLTNAQFTDGIAVLTVPAGGYSNIIAKNYMLKAGVKYTCIVTAKSSVDGAAMYVGKHSGASGEIYSIGLSTEYKTVQLTFTPLSNGEFIASRLGATENVISIKEIKICSVLLEYKPENIRVDRMINTGIAGSAYDLIYSLPTKPTIIYEAPYKDKIVLEDKTTPDFNPIAVGQRCYTSDGKILEAKLPVKGSEWAVSDWKQTSA